MKLTRDQIGQSGDGILGINTLGFDSQHCSTLSGKAEQLQDAPAVRCAAVAANLDIGLECLRQSHELISGSQMEPEDVGNSDLTTGDMELLSHCK